VDVTLPADLDADFSARTSNGGIRHDGLTLSVIEQSRRRLDGTLGRGGSPITLQTTNGSIRVRAR
jgi:hypothetical protein